LGKSLAQIGSPLSRLARDGQISLNGHVANGSPLAARADVFPTRAALRSLPAFANLADGALDRELDRLRGGCRDTVIGQQTH
jgi:lysozyme family protein